MTDILVGQISLIAKTKKNSTCKSFEQQINQNKNFPLENFVKRHTIRRIKKWLQQFELSWHKIFLIVITLAARFPPGVIHSNNRSMNGNDSAKLLVEIAVQICEYRERNITSVAGEQIWTLKTKNLYNGK